MSNIHLAAICLTCALTSQLLIKAIYRYALQHLIDTPNARSSHSTPTPRGGGIAVAASSTLTLGYLAYFAELIPAHTLNPIIFGCSSLAILGYIDDHHSLSRRLRLGVTLATLASCIYILPSTKLALGELTISTPWILLPLLICASTWIINLFNFMDGIDGIATIKLITVFSAASLLLYTSNALEWSQLLIIMTIPALTFLTWNFSPAKIFLGDAGSYFWGGLIALLAITTSALTELNLWCWTILFATFIADSTWTLITRFRTGQKWNDPHRSHAYQKLAIKFQSHRVVSLATGAITLLWLTPIAYLAMTNPEYGYAYTIAAYTPLIYLCYASKAGLTTEPSTD